MPDRDETVNPVPSEARAVVAMAHAWFPVVAFDNGQSTDTVWMCARCGVVKHDYTPASPNYPRYFWSMASPIPTGWIGVGLEESNEEPACRSPRAHLRPS